MHDGAGGWLIVTVTVTLVRFDCVVRCGVVWCDGGIDDFHLWPGLDGVTGARAADSGTCRYFHPVRQVQIDTWIGGSWVLEIPWYLALVWARSSPVYSREHWRLGVDCIRRMMCVLEGVARDQSLERKKMISWIFLEN